MPCKQHPTGSDTCVECLIDALVLFHWVDQEKGKVFPAMLMLSKRLAKVKEAEDYASNLGVLEVLVAEANRAALKQDSSVKKLLSLEVPGGSLAVPFDSTEFTSRHRHGYRQYVGRTGSWLGMTEIQALARRFQVTFPVYFTSNQSFFDLGLTVSRDCTIHSHCLVFTGNHWEVGEVEDRNGRVLARRIATNGLGDCSLEAFLTLLAVAYPITAANLRPRLWRSVDAFRALRRTHCTGPTYYDAVPAQSALPVVTELRTLLKGGLTEQEVTDGLAAVPGLRLMAASEESSSTKLLPVTLGKGKWAGYAAHVSQFFRLTKALQCEATADQSLVVITNIPQVDTASVLKKSGAAVSAALGLTSAPQTQRLYRAVTLPKAGLVRLVHLGVMVACIERTDGKTTHVVCTIANFAAGRREEV
ncbi:MAG TPA: hypothetical protein VFQ61_17900, partial [Polyangiaceae bacterium]|nr:hypothetical protein [Polyangiaceae bacterium]